MVENAGPDRGAREGISRIVSELDLGKRENIALVGGGGKTGLMFALAEALCLSGKKVVSTTTTKVFKGQAERYPKVILSGTGLITGDVLKEDLEKQGVLFIGHRFTGSGKVEGISGEEADLLFENKWIDYLIAEADGSAGRPLKAHADHEPVFPGSASMVIAVAGLDALGKKMGPDIVFREELFSQTMGIKAGEMISEEVLAEVFSRPNGLFRGSPVNSKRIAFLNKIDVLKDDKTAATVARLILEKEGTVVDFVVTGSLMKGSYSVYRKRI
jgi:probable selenium-dependent hydroxylase accessory protein YqeC